MTTKAKQQSLSKMITFYSGNFYRRNLETLIYLLMKGFLEKQSSEEYERTKILLLSSKLMCFCERASTVVFLFLCKTTKILLRVGKWERTSKQPHFVYHL